MLRRRHVNLIAEHEISFCVDGTKDKVKSTGSLVLLITWAASSWNLRTNCVRVLPLAL